MLFFKFSQGLLVIIVELLQFGGWFCEDSFKIVSGPLDCVFNLIWEVLQCAKWDGFFWWINDVSIAQCVMRNDDLRVTFCSESSTFKQWFFVPNALLVNILSSLNIINGIDNKIKSGPETIVEEFFVLLADS